MSNTPRPIQSVSNTELYNRWAKVYDTDGNILQALDDHLLPDLLNHALTLLPSTSISITELGCGTARNTLKLLSLPAHKTIIALDLSPAMLDVAQSRCSASSNPPIFLEFDALNPSRFPAVQDLPKADLVLSTLVLEHLPIEVFFDTVKGLMKEGGVLVLTNMHAEMGRLSRAGFVDEEKGVKVRGESFVYGVQEVVDAGKERGFVVEGELKERAVQEADLKEGIVGTRGRKWVGNKCWFGVVMQYHRIEGL